MDKQETIQYLESRLKDNPKSLLFARLADFYLGQKRIDDAIKLCTAGVEHHPDYITGHFILAKAYLAKKNFEKAEELLKKVLSFDRKYLAAHKILADNMIKMGLGNRAADHYKEILSIDPLDEDSRESFEMLSVMEDELPDEVTPEFIEKKISESPIEEPLSMEHEEETGTLKDSLHQEKEGAADEDWFSQIEEIFPDKIESSSDDEEIATDKISEPVDISEDETEPEGPLLEPSSTEEIKDESVTPSPMPEKEITDQIEEEVSESDSTEETSNGTSEEPSNVAEHEVEDFYLSFSEDFEEVREYQLSDKQDKDKGSEGKEQEKRDETEEESLLKEPLPKLEEKPVDTDETVLSSEDEEEDFSFDYVLEELHQEKEDEKSPDQIVDQEPVPEQTILPAQESEDETTETGEVGGTVEIFSVPEKEIPKEPSDSKTAPVENEASSEEDHEDTQIKAEIQEAESKTEEGEKEEEIIEPEPKSQPIEEEKIEEDIASTFVEIKPKEKEPSDVHPPSLEKEVNKKSEEKISKAEKTSGPSSSEVKSEQEETPPKEPAKEEGPKKKEKIVTPTLAEIYTAQEQYEKAIKVYEQLLEKEPDNKRFQDKIEELKKKLS